MLPEEEYEAVVPRQRFKEYRANAAVGNSQAYFDAVIAFRRRQTLPMLNTADILEIYK